ncbi:MAG TPA: PilW family protein, partial [Burkholderiaceae bacterium]|nr:PilW family protein [Burkholderiaceae bacterium]
MSRRLSLTTSAVQRGVSLIELMIAMTLGLIVASVVTGFFGPASNNRRELESVARLHDNAAYAAELLSDELRAAGYYGELRQTGLVWQTPDACATSLATLGWATPANVPVPVMGIDKAQATPACITDRRAGTDIVTLRRVDVAAVNAATVTSGAFLQVSKCLTDDPATPFIVSATGSNFVLQNRDCTTAAQARRILVRSYFIHCANGCAAGNRPTLTRAELSTDAGGNLAIVRTPLVDGIENMQLEYGFDTNNDGMPDVFRIGLSGTAGAADNDWSNVVAVR